MNDAAATAQALLDGPRDQIIEPRTYALLVVALLFTALVHYTPFGLRLRATGAHRDAARAAGIRTNRYVAASYVFSGIAAALARSSSGDWAS